MAADAVGSEGAGGGGATGVAADCCSSFRDW